MDSIVFPELPTYLFEPSPAGLLSLAVTVGLPLLAAVCLRGNWSTAQKGVVLLALAAVKAFLEAWLGAGQGDDSFNFATTGYAVLVNFLIAVAIYFGLFKGTGLHLLALKSGLRERPATKG